MPCREESYEYIIWLYHNINIYKVIKVENIRYTILEDQQTLNTLQRSSKTKHLYITSPQVSCISVTTLFKNSFMDADETQMSINVTVTEVPQRGRLLGLAHKVHDICPSCLQVQGWKFLGVHCRALGLQAVVIVWAAPELRDCSWYGFLQVYFFWLSELTIWRYHLLQRNWSVVWKSVVIPGELWASPWGW